MARIAAAQALARGGDRAGAATAFSAVWADVGEDRDALHVVSLAHYAGDVQDDPREELAWDRIALRAACRLTVERARRYHEPLEVRGLLPSLHLNLAADHAKLDEPGEARRHLAEAEAVLDALPDDAYGRTIRGAVAALRTELGPA